MARALPKSASLRARRWDALVLGGALGGLAAAVKLGRAGLRVCVVEEEEAARLPNFLREPFFLPGLAGEGPLDASLRELGLPPIERRDLVADPVAFQVLLPEARVDVGRAELLASELVSWGLAKPEDAEAAVAALSEAGRAADAHLSALEWVRRGGLRGFARGAPRDRPAGAASGPAALARAGARGACSRPGCARSAASRARRHGTRPSRACSPHRSPEARRSRIPTRACGPCSSAASKRCTASSEPSRVRSGWPSSAATRASRASGPTTSGSGAR